MPDRTSSAANFFLLDRFRRWRNNRREYRLARSCGQSFYMPLPDSPWPDCEQCEKPAWDHYDKNISRFKIAPYGPFGLTANHQPVISEKSK